jgi:hypothetical protein
MTLRPLILLMIGLLFPQQTDAQCFGSPGNPAAGTSNLGVLQKKVLRVSLFHKYSYSDTYFTGNKKSDEYLYENANFNFAGNIIAYGLFDQLTLEAETGYFINKTLNYRKDIQLPLYTQKGYGFNHTVLSFKFLLADDEKSPVKWSAAAGAKIPLRANPQQYKNSVLPIDAQPSNMAAGAVLQSFLLRENSLRGLRYFMINRYEYNLKNSQDYKWGQAFFSSLFISKRLHFKQQWLTENWTAILQLRHEMKTHNYNYKRIDHPKVDASGSHLVFFTPQLNYTANTVWNISLLIDIPVFQYYNGTQIGSRFACGLTITRDFPPKDFIY